MTNSEILKFRNVKKQPVKEFCEKYKKTNVDDRRKTMVSEIMNPHYVPYEEKITVCKQIVNSSCYQTVDRDGVKVKKLHADSSAKYMLFCLNMVRCYTNLEINFKNSLAEFNMLNEYGALDEIYSQIPEKEAKEFHMILEMIESDLLTNEYENHAFISNQVERFADLFGHLASPALDKLMESLGNMDEKTLNNIIDGLFKLIQ